MQLCDIESSNKKSASRAGLAVAAEPLGRLGLERVADDMMASPGSSRGYRSGEMLSAFMLILHERAASSRQRGGAALQQE